MYCHKKILALIPARGQSKGIKNKNIINLFNKPLISYTIETACKSVYIDSVVVSTDSSRIRSVALKYGARVPFLRPKNLATDTARMTDVVIHAIKALEEQGEKFDICILLQPTQPLRNSFDIDNSLKFFIKNKQKSLVSVCEVENHPLFIRTLDNRNILHHLIDKPSDVRRQDMNKYFYINGAIYINKIEEINDFTRFNDNEIGYIMPKIRSVDLDEAVDLIIAEALMKNDK